jgi:hypothetical protein
MAGAHDRPGGTVLPAQRDSVLPGDATDRAKLIAGSGFLEVPSQPTFPGCRSPVGEMGVGSDGSGLRRPDHQVRGGEAP